MDVKGIKKKRKKEKRRRREKKQNTTIHEQYRKKQVTIIYLSKFIKITHTFSNGAQISFIILNLQKTNNVIKKKTLER